LGGEAGLPPESKSSSEGKRSAILSDVLGEFVGDQARGERRLKMGWESRMRLRSCQIEKVIIVVFATKLLAAEGPAKIGSDLRSESGLLSG